MLLRGATALLLLLLVKVVVVVVSSICSMPFIGRVAGEGFGDPVRKRRCSTSRALLYTTFRPEGSSTVARSAAGMAFCVLAMVFAASVQVARRTSRSLYMEGSERKRVPLVLLPGIDDDGDSGVSGATLVVFNASR